MSVLGNLTFRLGLQDELVLVAGDDLPICLLRDWLLPVLSLPDPFIAGSFVWIFSIWSVMFCLKLFPASTDWSCFPGGCFVMFLPSCLEYLNCHANLRAASFSIFSTQKFCCLVSIVIGMMNES